MSTLAVIHADTKRSLGCATFPWTPDSQFDLIHVDGTQFIVVGHIGKAISVRPLTGDVPDEIRVIWDIPPKQGKPAVPRYRSKCQPNEFIAPPRVSVKRTAQWHNRKWPKIDEKVEEVA